jgi:uncharacterized protein YbjT (DUF2867 family)
VRALVRSAAGADKVEPYADDVITADALDPQALAGVCRPRDIVFSALGASVATGAAERRGYAQVDAAANLNLLAEARRAGVRRFVYTAVFVQPGYAATRYVRAHEAVAAAVLASGLPATVVRPTGFFTAMLAFLPMARRGVIPLVGGGAARSNPIHPADLAAACVEILRRGPADLPLGGPEVLTRRQIGEAAFAAVGKPPRFMPVPLGVMLAGAAAARLAKPRMGELLAFAGRVSAVDCVAPAYGTRTLADYFREQVARSGQERA